jgi:tetratricopeptide (TPR) repeat protein
MKTLRILSILAMSFLLCATAAGQRRISIPAGTPEDQALQAITNETDNTKKIALLEDFVGKFATNASAAAYGNWQLAQQYAAIGQQQKALAAGDKALAAMPDVLDILVSQADIAQQIKSNEKVVDYATRGAAVYHAIPPDGETPEAMASYKQQYEYLETIGYNAIASEQNATKRMAEIDRYLPSFSNGRFTQNLATLAIVSFQEMKDMAGLSAFADKVLKDNANDMRLLTVLSGAFVESNPVKAGTFARKALELQAKEADNPEAKSLAGVAHSVLGQALVRESKFAPAVAELKTATTILKGSPQDEAAAYYFLGFAYAKLERGGDAVAALTQAAKEDTPYRGPAQELMGKIQAARRGKK